MLSLRLASYLGFCRRINQVLDLYSTIENPSHPQTANSSVKGQVEYCDVTFRYSKNSEAVVEHVSFKAEAGETIAFIGSTGSGKSTLVNLLPRFYDVSDGENSSRRRQCSEL